MLTQAVRRNEKDLASRDYAFKITELYRVKTLRLNEQVRRNADRFPDDFLLRLRPAAANIARIRRLPSQSTAPSWPQRF
jgi:hypothetical protein